jgi:thioredoxin 1
VHTFDDGFFVYTITVLKLNNMAVVNVTDADFKQVLADHPNVIVKYYADWCGSCKLFAPKFKRLSNDENNAAVAFLEVDAENNPEARKASRSR